MTDNELFGISEQLNDTISRAAVVDAIEGVDWYHINRNGEMVHGANDAEHQAWYKADDIYAAIERVPSAVPVAKDINVPVKDCISRAAAIDAMRNEKTVETSVAGYASNAGIDWCIDAIKALPSAHPDFDAYCDRLYNIAYERGKREAVQWTSCKERLPEKDGEYLVTMLYFGEKTVEVDKFSHYETDDDRNGEPLWVYGYDNVIAWMPLPEPWEGGEE